MDVDLHSFLCSCGLHAGRSWGLRWLYSAPHVHLLAVGRACVSLLCGASMEAKRISPRLRMRHPCTRRKSGLVGCASEEGREGSTLGQMLAFLYAVVLAKPALMEALHRKQAHGLGGESCRTPEWPRMVLRSSVVVTLDADTQRPYRRFVVYGCTGCR